MTFSIARMLHFYSIAKMFSNTIFVLIVAVISWVTCDDPVKEMVGVETKHSFRVDKDTVIHRNMKIDQISRQKTAHEKPDKEEPDWSYSPLPEDVAVHVASFKRNMTECLREVQENDKRTVKRLSPKTESPVHGECLIACVFKRNQVIDNGKINKGNLIALAGKFYAKDTKVMKKLEKNLDRCIHVSTTIKANSKDECALAARLNECTNDLMSNNKHKIEINY